MNMKILLIVALAAATIGLVVSLIIFSKMVFKKNYELV